MTLLTALYLWLTTIYDIGRDLSYLVWTFLCIIFSLFIHLKLFAGVLLVLLFITPILVYIGLIADALLSPVSSKNWLTTFKSRARILIYSPSLWSLVLLFLLGCVAYFCLPVQFLLGPVWAVMLTKLEAAHPATFWGAYEASTGYCIAQGLTLKHPMRAESTWLTTILEINGFVAPEVTLVITTLAELQQAIQTSYTCGLRGLQIRLDLRPGSFAAASHLIGALLQQGAALSGEGQLPICPWGPFLFGILLAFAGGLLALGGAVLSGHGPAATLLAAMDHSALLKGVWSIVSYVVITLLTTLAFGGQPYQVFGFPFAFLSSLPTLSQGVHLPGEAADIASSVRAFLSMSDSLLVCSGLYSVSDTLPGGLTASLISAGVSQPGVEAAIRIHADSQLRLALFMAAVLGNAGVIILFSLGLDG